MIHLSEAPALFGPVHITALVLILLANIAAGIFLRRLDEEKLLRLLHRCFSAAERRNLLSTKPHIWVFQLYKLGYYATLNDAAKG